jgi:hypothetical protein
MSRRWRLVAAWSVLLWLLGCATASPLATQDKDRASLAGVWEEEWSGQTPKDRYRITVAADEVTVTPLTNAEKQKVRHVAFAYKRLSFYLDLTGGAVYYDLILANKNLLSGRVKGGAKNFDELVRWYRVE